MKRRFLAILLFLLLGAVVNVAVAWGCVGRKIEPHVHVVFDEDANHVWSCCRPADWPAIPDRGARYRRVGFNVKWSVYEWRDSYGSFAALDSAYGFPFPSMRCQTWLVQDDKGVSLLRYDWGWKVTLQVEDEVLPLRPNWPGFAANTFFYAFILWLLIRGPFVFRRHFRRRRGHCLKCGYDLRGDYDTGCPECGWNREGAAA